MYSPGVPHIVYCPSCWWSDNWDPLEYGKDYDFSRPFFEQFKELFQSVPLLGLSLDIPTSLQAPFNNHAGHLKNCYLLFHADRTQDCAYGFDVFDGKSSFDTTLATLSELCYDSMHSYRNSRCIGLRSQVTESLDCIFLKDCMNCQNCFGSANLRNKKYYFFNKPYTKEEYFTELKKWDLGSYTTYQKAKKLAEENWGKFSPKPTMDEFAINSSGSHVFESKNCKDCFEVVGAQDSKYLFMINTSPIKDCYDVSSWGNNMQLVYDSCNVGEYISNVKFSNETGINAYHIEYSKLATGGSYHFGTVSMKKGNYVIFNKKYTEDEFKKLRAKIIAHMNEMPYIDKKERVYKYGEFFPVEISPFGYNETMAQKFFPLSKEEIVSNGYTWREEEKREYVITKKASELPDHINQVSSDILKETIECEACGKGFRIIQMELDFLKKMNLPLPRQCPFCRIGNKVNQWVKNLRVFKRVCSKCSAEFETNYPKEEVDYIFCKKCYQNEVV